MKLNIRLAVLFVLVYLVALIALTPLSWIKQYLDPLLQASNLRLETLEGNLWQGRSQMVAPGIRPLQLEWDTRPLYLLSARLPVDLHLANPNLDLTGRLTLSPGGAGVSGLSGYLDDALFDDLAAAYGATLQGRLVVTDLAADADWGGRLGEASGELSWSGGPVSVAFGNSRQTFEVPQMAGRLSSNDDRWRVEARALDETPLILADLGRDGLGRLEVRRALAERMQLPVSTGRDVLFELSQQVF